MSKRKSCFTTWKSFVTHEHSMSWKTIAALIFQCNIFKLLLIDHVAFSGHIKVCSGSTLGSPTHWMCLGNLQWRVPRRHPDQMTEPLQLGPFEDPLVSFWSINKHHDHRWPQALYVGSLQHSRLVQCPHYCWRHSKSRVFKPFTSNSWQQSHAFSSVWRENTHSSFTWS